jgi:DNA mismatch repair protein MutL
MLTGGTFQSRWAPLPTPHSPLPTLHSPPPTPHSPLRTLVPLGQFRDTFIIAIDDEGVAIIDQHVAHERVLFERAMERLTSGRLESQRLLEPLLIDLPASGRQALVAHARDLERCGFEVEEFGGDSVRIGAVPAILSRRECEAAVRALAEDLEGLDGASRVEEALKRIAATTACHAAVKANDTLTHDKMVHLMEELRRTAYSTVCPHGRPVMLRLTRREIEKNFQRI